MREQFKGGKNLRKHSIYGCFINGLNFFQCWMVLITLFCMNKFHPILDGSYHIMDFLHGLQSNHFIGHGSYTSYQLGGV